MRGLYNLGINLYGFAIHLAALFQEKAKKWVSGRKGYFDNLPSELSGCIWIHCASLGEFEQGRPVIEELRRQRSEKILLTFFSPSGYEIRKNYSEADAVLYLPLDTPKNARRFLDHFSPVAAIFVKYEVWHNYYRELRLRNIPHYIVSAIFREEQIYFKPYGSWFLKTLQGVSHTFCQDSASRMLLRSNGVSKVSISGDTRFDRVKALASSDTAVPIVETWLQNRKAIIAGSTWPEDEELLLGALEKLPKEIAVIIAPHEIKPQKIANLKNSLSSIQLYSELSEESNPSQVLIVDQIGLLSRLYSYGIISIIGGGFGNGIHNTLEAAVYGIPIVFGPKYQKFKEAVDLIDQNSAFSVKNQHEFDQIMSKLLEDDVFRNSSGISAQTYVDRNAGATKLIIKEIIESLG